MNQPCILLLEQVGIKDIGLVGGSAGDVDHFWPVEAMSRPEKTLHIW